MTLKKITFVFCVLCTIIIYSCDIGNVPLEYTFDNRSSFTIQITLTAPYKTSNESEEKERTSPFSVYSSRVEKVYVKSNGIVDFQWTTNNIGDNPKVYCVTEGPKAVFKDR